jgi:hypothetical protein
VTWAPKAIQCVESSYIVRFESHTMFLFDSQQSRSDPVLHSQPIILRPTTFRDIIAFSKEGASRVQPIGVRDAEVVELVKLEDGKDENLRLGMGWGGCIKGGRCLWPERFFRDLRV